MNSLPVLRPLNLGELLDQAVSIYRRKFVDLAGILGIVLAPLTVLDLFISAGLIGPRAPTGYTGTFDLSDYTLFNLGFTLLQFILIQGVASAALARLVADDYLGRPTEMLEAYKRVGRSWFTLLGAFMLMAILGLLLAAWTVVPCIGWFTGPGILFFAAIAAAPLVMPIVVLERRGAFQSIRRAWDLARRRFWWLMGFVIALIILVEVIIVAPAAMLGYVIQLAVGTQTSVLANNFLQVVIESLTSMVNSLIFTPLQVIALVLVYFDLRVRTEGLDLILLAASGEDIPQDAASLIAHAPTVSNPSLVNGRDWGYFALITVIAIGGYLGCVFSMYALFSLRL